MPCASTVITAAIKRPTSGAVQTQKVSLKPSPDPVLQVSWTLGIMVVVTDGWKFPYGRLSQIPESYKSLLYLQKVVGAVVGKIIHLLDLCDLSLR